MKHWFVLSSSMQLIFGIPIMTLRQIWSHGGENAEDDNLVSLKTMEKQEKRRRLRIAEGSPPKLSFYFTTFTSGTLSLD